MNASSGFAEISKSAQMGGSFSKPFNMLFPGLRPIFRRPFLTDLWLLKSINITELALEAYIKTGVLSFKMLLSNVIDTPFNVFLDRIRDFYPARIRIKNPDFTR
jgi:hypothetical protein